ncbi:MAG: chemotaxis response regulator protein-glutamate methylesterase [Nitrospirae bacterium]|nr:MAG: chemotaxis response regulator protein-glutamate methylesterase [Nitrospirota bacterium]
MLQAMTAPIKVLVVDDSSFMRKVLSSMLEGDPRVAVVGVARNGEEALQKVAELHPDVVTMDVEMPGMNGLEALKRIMEMRPLPVIMVSSLTEEGARETLTALEWGAVDYIPKQLEGVSTNIAAIQGELIAKVVAAAGAKLRRSSSSAPGTQPGTMKKPPGGGVGVGLTSQSISATRGSKLVAIGCSTGGPAALLEVLPLLPEDFPAGIVIVQHMPKFFTKPFAERMNQQCRIEVREAQEADVVRPGLALIAPGGVHMRLVRRRAIEVEVALVPNTENRHYVPSADVLMLSVAEVYSSRGIGVILTGMGQDGLEGMRAIKGAKGRTVAQDEASCVVYGMPKAVVEGGLADKVAPLSHIAGEIVNMI